MSDEDIKEFHNIGQKPRLKKSNKYNYMQGKQITDLMLLIEAEYEQKYGENVAKKYKKTVL